MFAAIWEWLKGLFVGKGAMQIGSRNQAVSGVTVGDNAGGVTVGNQVHVYPAPPTPPASKTIEIEPTPAEIEILTRLASSPVGYLHRFHAEGNLVVSIDGVSLNSAYDAQSSVKVVEAVGCWRM